MGWCSCTTPASWPGVVDGKRGFKVVVGGGLGPVPHQAEVLSEFTPEEEFLPEIQAVARVFARLGEKKNRGRARIKFLVAKLGIEGVSAARGRGAQDHSPRPALDGLPG